LPSRRSFLPFGVGATLTNLRSPGAQDFRTTIGILDDGLNDQANFCMPGTGIYPHLLEFFEPAECLGPVMRIVAVAAAVGVQPRDLAGGNVPVQVASSRLPFLYTPYVTDKDIGSPPSARNMPRVPRAGQPDAYIIAMAPSEGVH
jgi:hypothetical protein